MDEDEEEVVPLPNVNAGILKKVEVQKKKIKKSSVPLCLIFSDLNFLLFW